MSTILQRGEIWYYVFHHNGRQVWRSLKTKDKATAKRIQKINDGKLEQRKLGLAPKNVKLAVALETHLNAKRQTLKSGTFTRYQEIVKNLSSIGVEYCHKLTIDDLNDYIAGRRKEGRANKTIHEELVILKAALVRACSRDQIEQLLKDWPVLSTTIEKEHTVGHYGLDDIEALKEYFKSKEFERFFLFALYTGCRRSEISALTWSAIDLRSGTIRIRNIKTETDAKNQFRTISIHPELRRIFNQPGKLTDLVFPEQQKHSRNWPYRQMEIACAELGIQYRRFHGIRHTTATFLLAGGVSLRDVMSIMGWTRIDTAQRYIHLANRAAEQIAKLPY